MIKEILKILENDARATPEHISTMTGVTSTEVTKAIKQAETKPIAKEGMIFQDNKEGKS